tara:strand:- start:173 stop:676 length:504 start_codon:yes stop_codon:yes gene_type:complete
MTKESDILKRMKTAVRLEQEGKITSSKNTSFTTKDQQAIKEITKNLTEKAKKQIVKNPGIGKTALKNMLTTKNVPAALALTAATLAYDFFKNKKGVADSKPLTPEARKTVRNRIKQNTKPKKEENTRKKVARKQGRGLAHGGPVKSKYITNNKRYANGGKIYPKMGK